MDVDKVGRAIAYLRKRAGYTQKDLADRIGVSDKAVSKWERGVGLPEIGYLRKLTIILDTDIDSLLAGDVVHHDNSWQGIIIFGDNNYGIGGDTIIFDKPLINYLISYFLLVGIRDISILGTEKDKTYIDNTLGSGENYGIRIHTMVGTIKDLVSIKQWTGNIMMVYGRCFLYGVDQTRFFQKAMMNRDKFTMMVLPKKITKQYRHFIFDQHKRVIHANTGEPLRTQYDFSDIPIVFFPSEMLKQVALENDISTFIENYASKHDLYVNMLDRGFVEIEIDDWSNVQEASEFVRIVQDKCGMNVYCVEEVAWRRGFISLNQLKVLGMKYANTEYGDYIDSLYHRFVDSFKEDIKEIAGFDS